MQRYWVSAGIVLAVLTTAFWATASPPTSEPPALEPRTSIAEARRQAELLHVAVHATLHVVHHEYYREDQGLAIPAAVMQDVFRGLKRDGGVTLRWLAVEGTAMNVEHLARTPFEQETVKQFLAGKTAHEEFEAGVYRRVGAITLTAECLKCHVPDRKNTRDRRAGLIIEIPIDVE